MDTGKQQTVTGLASIAIGTPFVLIGLGVMPFDPADIHAPGWVIALAGAVFVLAGIALTCRSRPVVVSIAGNLLVAAFAAIAMWIAVAAPSEQFSGGIPFLPHERNVSIGRYVFGFGGVLCLLMLAAGLRHLVRMIRA